MRGGFISVPRMKGRARSIRWSSASHGAARPSTGPGHVDLAFMLPSQARRGVGAALLRAVDERARD